MSDSTFTGYFNWPSKEDIEALNESDKSGEYMDHVVYNVDTGKEIEEIVCSADQVQELTEKKSKQHNCKIIILPEI